MKGLHQKKPEWMHRIGNRSGRGVIFFVTVAIILSVSLALPAFAAPPAADENAPISINADQMEADDRTKVITFMGRVVARQKDVVLNCDLMRVYYDSGEEKTTPASASDPNAPTADPLNTLGDEEAEIDRIECEGNVKVTQGDKTLMSEKAVYLARANPRVIIFTGEPRIYRNRDYLTGKRITYFLDENRSVVEGGRGSRVHTQFYKSSDGNESETRDGGSNQ